MGKITLITGGYNSGKSRWAVSYFDCCDNIQYLCTSSNLDKSTMERIIFTESSHNVCWDIRCNFQFDDPPPDLLEYDNFIIDSVGELAATKFFHNYDLFTSSEKSRMDSISEEFVHKVTDFVSKIKSCGGNVIVITNEIGFFPAFFGGKASRFDNTLSRVNQRLAAMADEVYFSVSGIQFKIK